MSLVPYALARRVLFSLDAEVAHEITMAGLAATQGNPLKLAKSIMEKSTQGRLPKTTPNCCPLPLEAINSFANTTTVIPTPINP